MERLPSSSRLCRIYEDDEDIMILKLGKASLTSIIHPGSSVNGGPVEEEK